MESNVEDNNNNMNGEIARDGGAEDEQSQKNRGGSCSSGSSGAGVGEYSAADGQCHMNPKTPLYKLAV